MAEKDNDTEKCPSVEAGGKARAFTCVFVGTLGRAGMSVGEAGGGGGLGGGFHWGGG